MNNLDLANRLVDRCLDLGAGDAETYILDSESTEIQILNGQPEAVNFRHRNGYGLRILIDGRMGFASSNNLELSAADNIIKKLITNTQQHTADDHNVLPEMRKAPAIDFAEQFDESLKSIPISEKIEKAVDIEKAAREADQRIIQIGWLQYGDSVDYYAIASSLGISDEARRSNVYGYVVAVAMEMSNGGQPNPASAQTGTGIKAANDYIDLDPHKLGEKAASFAVRMLGATDGETAESGVIFPPETGYSIIDLIAETVSADLVQKKKSLFSGRIGEQVASNKVNIIDNGSLKDGLASAAIDAEGIPTGETKIIKDGALVGLLYDSYTAHRGNTRPTGNSSRLSYSSRPSIAPTNFYLKPGNLSRDSLLASVDRGLYITEVSGLHTAVDPITGNFSIPSKGLMISSGELTQPITNITISGNIFDLLKNIDGIANDLTWETRGNVIGVPSFRVKGIKIGGK